MTCEKANKLSQLCNSPTEENGAGGGDSTLRVRPAPCRFRVQGLCSLGTPSLLAGPSFQPG